MNRQFIDDKRLGIRVPQLDKRWEDYSAEEQEAILLEWEAIRGSIPDRIATLERQINEKQDALSHEADFARSCQLNADIAELASIINDLWIWYRTVPSVSSLTEEKQGEKR
ncbi:MULTISPECIES: hypothetical protein [Geobacillus]|jgi:hypothetical protein|uniref:Uncharacterized protein n=2 Tax=Geobacillus thermodenitrificans TaxID=33940 RepID=A4IRS4_GEOTN|nr:MULTISPECIES: hypothetical protein [Geobacillus]ABO68028.1 Conserved hypothetical protein [Geobacillus thermodenitrificans NG80-2]ARA98813.1 hypothetical protein GD3902_12745 [Geobacillus thermodenitrificans]ARP43775.1 hypothetical protein GTHT12_02253 [Geobacillus thermodenitrificans]ATO38180.1 hypothetical protein GTID1_13960 [Geobacillus thermodenitrificans]KQB92323.1 hypothetical protein GEPA3_2737 [Geobacillus sp. PA-3]